MVVVIKKGMKRKEIEKLLSKLPKRKGLDAKKYSGILKSRIDPLEYQRQMRNEWR